MTTLEPDPKRLEQSSYPARHLAAHAAFALRAGFRVERVELDGPSVNQRGITCDWRQSREVYADDTKLIHRSFALAYIGGLIDQQNSAVVADELSGEMKADMAAAEESRQTAVAWNLASSVRDTNPFAHIGYKLASRFIRRDKLLIDQLTALLIEERILDEKSLMKWYHESASPYPLDELETMNTY